MIAMALVNDPDLLIADEPTTALDVTTQAQILRLLKRLQQEFGSAIIMITHDLGVVAETADDVVVMYAAKVVEQGPVDKIFSRPRHPYTWGLLGSLPRLDADVERLVQIPGQPPSLLNPPPGCRFHPRCPYVMDVCRQQVPLLAAGARRPGASPGMPPGRGDEAARGGEGAGPDDGGGKLDTYMSEVSVSPRRRRLPGRPRRPSAAATAYPPRPTICSSSRTSRSTSP